MRLHQVLEAKGALFSQVAVVGRDNLSVKANGNKLAVVDSKATIQRHACKECGVHMYGRIEKQGPSAVRIRFHHTSAERAGVGAARIRAFVSSIIDRRKPRQHGCREGKVERAEARALRLPVPPLMDFIGLRSPRPPARCARDVIETYFGNCRARIRAFSFPWVLFSGIPVWAPAARASTTHSH